MNDDLTNNFFIADGDRDPLRSVKRDQAQPKAKRFYETVAVAKHDDGFAVLLDGKPIRTPAGAPLSLPTTAAAELVADEWRAQRETIDPATMPVTRLVNSALDGVARDVGAVAADMAKYLGSDLVCYRAGESDGLAAAQAAAWDPVLAFAQRAFGARFVLGEGVTFVAQPPGAVASAARAVESHATADDAALRLAALHSMTTLTGSALIPLAHVGGALALEEAWAAAHVDEDHQMRVWGQDSEALARRARRFDEMKAASTLFAAL